MKVFEPFSTQVSPSRRAVVEMPASSEPAPGSVMATPRTTSPDAPLELEDFPASRGLLANVFQRAVAPDEESTEEEPEIAALAAGLDAVHTATRTLRAAGLLADGELLRAPLSGLP
jgi:hypothetical protein